MSNASTKHHPLIKGGFPTLQTFAAMSVDLGMIFLSSCRSELTGLALRGEGELLTLSVDDRGQERVDAAVIDQIYEGLYKFADSVCCQIPTAYRCAVGLEQADVRLWLTEALRNNLQNRLP